MKTSQPMLDSFAEKLSDISGIDKQPLIEGRNMSMILAPKSGGSKKKAPQDAKQDSKEQEE
jgi:translation initiation factor IF-3